MSARRPNGPDQTGREIPDEMLADQLARRAARPAPRALVSSIMARVDETVPERRWRLAVAAWRPRMARAASGLALVLVAGLLVINAMPAPVGTDRSSPSPSASGPAPSGVTWDPTQRALTPPELLQILKSNPSVGTTLIVDDQIAPTNASCPSADHCPTGQLVNAGGTFIESPTGGELPFTTEGGTPSIAGPVALAVGDGPNLVYLGSVVSNGVRLGFSVGDLQARNATGGLFVIPGWLSMAPARSCPVAEPGCSHPDWLTEAASIEPDRAPVKFAVQPGAYLVFAQDPGARVSSQGAYLVRDGDGHGEVVARLRTVPIPPDTTAPLDGTDWYPQNRPLTAQELLAILATKVDPDTVVVVDDGVVPVTPCTGSGCRAGHLATDSNVFVDAPARGHLPFGASSEIPGPVALQVANGSNPIFLGTVARNGQQMAFAASGLIGRGTRNTLYVVEGWLWKTGPVPCPTTPGTPQPTPTPTSELGLPAPFVNVCAGGNYLTEQPPDLPITSSPRDGFLVQNRAYSVIWPMPEDTSSARLGVYLVRDWGTFGEIVARLDRRHVAAPGVVPSTPPSGPSGPTSSTGRVMPVDEFVGRVLDGSLSDGAIVVADIPAPAVSVLSPTGAGEPEHAGQSRWIIQAGGGFVRVDGIAQEGIAGLQAFLVEPSRAVLTLGAVTADDVGSLGLMMVHGWLRIGPPLPCPAPARPAATGVRGEPLAWSQCPGTWILPSADDPWAGPPNKVQATDGSGTFKVGDGAVPTGTLHVQDNAAGASLEASEGVWLVRRVFSNTCPPWAFCTFTPADRPGPGVSWYELVGPIASPSPDSVEQRPRPTPPPWEVSPARSSP